MKVAAFSLKMAGHIQEVGKLMDRNYWNPWPSNRIEEWWEWLGPIQRMQSWEKGFHLQIVGQQQPTTLEECNHPLSPPSPHPVIEGLMVWSGFTLTTDCHIQLQSSRFGTRKLERLFVTGQKGIFRDVQAGKLWRGNQFRHLNRWHDLHKASFLNNGIASLF